MQYAFLSSSRRRLIALPLPALLAGCAIPAATPPPATISAPAAAQSLPGDATAAWPKAQGDDGWWRAMGDAQLDALIEEGLAHSPDLAAAAARLAKADAITSSAGGAVLPIVDAGGNVGVEKISTKLGYPPQFEAFLPQGWLGNGQLDATLSFNPDLWGKYRALLAAATSQRDAAAYDAAAARAALAAAIAQGYFAFAGDAAHVENARAALANREDNASLVAARFAHGFGTKADVADAAEARDDAQGQLAAAQAMVLVDRHRLAALLGAGPDRGLAITAPSLAPAGGRALPENVTTDLLGRRPDIAAARARAAAATAQVRAARADFFPSFRLSALIGWQAVGIANLLTPGSLMGNAGPAVSLPIFHGGAIRAQYKGARADADAAVADYNRTVVGAYQELADAVARRDALLRQRDDAAAALANADTAAAVADARFRHGLANRIDVLGAQVRQNQARDALAAAEAGAHQADVALIHALGGGFMPVTGPTLAQSKQP